jgi:hypothetical protein
MCDQFRALHVEECCDLRRSPETVKTVDSGSACLAGHLGEEIMYLCKFPMGNLRNRSCRKPRKISIYIKM